MRTFEERSQELSQLIGQVVKQVTAASQQTCQQDPSATLAPQELKIIEFLGERSPRIMRELCEAMSLPLSTGTGVVDKLVEKGLVLRDRLPEDRRVVAIELSSLGKEVFLELLRQHLAISQAMLEALTAEEQEMLVMLMRKVVRNRP